MADKIYMSRSHYLHKLCRYWILERRPDVYEAIVKEVENRYPRKIVKLEPNVLPESIRKLK